MSFDLTDTNASQIAATLLQARRQAGSPTMAMVLTLVVVTDEAGHYSALKTATSVSKEHPARILGVIRGSGRGESRVDAEVRIGEGMPGESVLLRMSGELTKHAESVVLPLLLPDSPVVTWWPTRGPEDPAADPLGGLAQRRITDSANEPRGKTAILRARAERYTPGDTDLAWTRLTRWRALLAAALDQHPVRVSSAEVNAERISPSADLLAAWLAARLDVPVHCTTSRGPGITLARLRTDAGDIAITRRDGRLAQFSVPGRPDRPVALRRREVAELLAEDLRCLDPDDMYGLVAETLLEMGKDFPRAAPAPV